MTVPAWPAGLPSFVLRDGFSLGMRDGRLISPMDSGPPKQRKRFSSAPRVCAMAIIITDDQLDDWETFWNTTTSGGSLPFTKPNPLNTGETWTLMFGDQTPAITHLGGPNYRIAFNVLVMP